MLWLKFLHIAALAVWIAGLLYLAVMLVAHRRVTDRQDFVRVRMASRFIYMVLASPAAFIAIGAGTALLFVADALHPWMLFKLMAVGLLVIGHLQYGHVLTHLADEEASAPTIRVKVIAAVVLLSTLATLTLVLAKPAFDTRVLPDWLTTPGLLDRPETEPPLPAAPPRPLLRS